MYHSKAEILKKHKQVMALYNELLNYRGKIFVNDGFDEKTQTYPFLTQMGSFLSHSRSIFQYAYKEAKQLNKLSDYEVFVTNHPMVKLFRDLRDIEIHDSSLGKWTTVTLESKINLSRCKKTTTVPNADSEPSKPAVITVCLAKKLEVSQELIDELTKEGREDMPKDIAEGKTLYEEVSFNGESDIFKLMEIYVKTIDDFIEYGIQKKFIT